MADDGLVVGRRLLRAIYLRPGEWRTARSSAKRRQEQAVSPPLPRESESRREDAAAVAMRAGYLEELGS